MAKSADQTETSGQTMDAGTTTDAGTTMIELAVRPDGTWEATQTGLEIVGTGESAARATEDLAGRIAEKKEAGEL